MDRLQAIGEKLTELEGRLCRLSARLDANLERETGCTLPELRQAWKAVKRKDRAALDHMPAGHFAIRQLFNTAYHRLEEHAMTAGEASMHAMTAEVMDRLLQGDTEENPMKQDERREIP